MKDESQITDLFYTAMFTFMGIYHADATIYDNDNKAAYRSSELFIDYRM